MEFLFNFVTGPIGAFLMVAFGVFGLIYFVLVIPYKIATDEKTLFGKRFLNIAYGIVSVFMPFLSLLYIFSNAKTVVKPLLIAIFCILGAGGMFMLRGFIHTFFLKS